jgi:chromosome segregation protein
MKLKKLEINGFKSFGDRVAIEFPQGVCAIVGPNGCGKSNIVDAMRWVMGEQSVKQLRGKSMEDVIFSGANGKPPVNLAEVTLTLLNDNGSAPEELKDYTEIALTRRLFRSGESAYLLNRQPCRLKDIHNVFLGSGMGSKSYSVIQQGSIGAIIDAGPDELRYFLEEAAGTTRFKARKTEALRKVQSTNQNLLRVSDIISEIQRQMNGLKRQALKRQASKAERYKRYRQRIRELDERLSLHRYARLSLQHEESDALLRELKDTDLDHSAKLHKIDSAVEEIKLQRWQKNEAISEQKSRKFELTRSIDRAENDLQHLQNDSQRLNVEIRELTQSQENLQDKHRKMEMEIREADAERNRWEQEIGSVKQTLNDAQSHCESIKVRKESVASVLESAKSELMDLLAREARFRNVQQNVSTNKENLQRRRKRVDEEVAAAGRNVADGRRKKLDAQQRLADLQQRLAAVRSTLETVRRQHEEKRQALVAQVKTVQTLEMQRANTRSQYAALKKMEENFEWYRDGVRAVMQSDRFRSGNGSASGANAADETGADVGLKKEIIGLLADLIEPEAEYQVAVESALGESLQYILVDEPETGVRAIDFLQTGAKGRSGFVPVSTVMALGEERRSLPKENHRLMQHVTVKDGYEKIAEAFLGHVVVAETLKEALDTFRTNGDRLTIVTRRGDILSRQGIMVGGSPEKLSGILAKKQEIKALQQEIDSITVRLQSAGRQQETFEEEARRLESTLQRRIEESDILKDEETTAEKELYKVSEELKHAERSLEIAELEQEQLLGEESDIDDEMARTRQTLAALAESIDTAKKQVADQTAHLEKISAEMEHDNQQLIDLKLELTALNARLENSRSTLRRLKEFQEDDQRRLEQTQTDIERKTRKLESAETTAETLSKQLSEHYEELKQLESELESSESDYQSIDSRLQESDRQIAALKDEREKIQEKARVLELEQTQRNVHLENLAKRLEEQYDLPFVEYAAALREIRSEIENAAEPVSLEPLEQKLEQLRKKIANIGEVNLGAIHEYEEMQTRYEFLCTQRDDLHQAIDDLQRVIKKINRITQQRFLETFEQVNTKLQEVFPRLFEGGSAKLILNDPDNLLESGVEYLVTPPGKKVTRMSLLSGGEKAMAAIAFVFSMFLLKPASFCLMDEIDAPLDESNVYRFNNLLKIIGEKSQIVLVTHNKKSMEFADVLFGITMENKGLSKVVSVNLNR